DRKPLIAAGGHRNGLDRVRRNERRAWQQVRPIRRQRNEIGAVRAVSVQKNNQRIRFSTTLRRHPGAIEEHSHELCLTRAFAMTSTSHVSRPKRSEEPGPRGRQSKAVAPGSRIAPRL